MDKDLVEILLKWMDAANRHFDILYARIAEIEMELDEIAIQTDELWASRITQRAPIAGHPAL